MNLSCTILRGRRGAAIERTVAELKTILRDIILEVGELKERVALLEAARVPGDVREAEKRAGRLNDEGAEPADPLETETRADKSSPSGLRYLYLEGRHICPLAFGEERSEGCLFCAALLARRDSE